MSVHYSYTWNWNYSESIIQNYRQKMGWPGFLGKNKNTLQVWILSLIIQAYLIYNIIFRISTEIEKRSDLFAQLEMLTRGILSKDTKHKALPLLAQYFRYYSAFAFTSVNESSTPKPLGMIFFI